MKRIYLLLAVLMILLLTGCSHEIPMKEQNTNKITYTPPEPKFEPSPYQIARLYNAGLPKALLKAKTGEYFTVILPHFYEGSYSLERNKTCSDFSYAIVPPGTYYNDKGDLEKDYVIAVIEYVAEADIQKYDTNIWRAELLEAVVPEENFKDKRFETYAEYVAAYEESVNALFKPTGEAGAVYELTGELEPIKGSRMVDSLVIDEESYPLPFTTYKFQMSSGNYLFVRLQQVSQFVEGALAEGGALRQFILPTKDVKNKIKNSVIDYLTNFDVDYTDLMDELMPGIIYGDMSKYYEPTKVTKPDNENIDSKFSDDEEGSVSDNAVDEDEEEVDEVFGADVDVKQQKYKDLLDEGAKVSNPKNSDSVINGFDPEDTYGGYFDYDQDNGGETFE